MAKFSIIIPLYNCKKYIVEALESAVNQDYQDFEVIVINDGSTDGSEKLIELVPRGDLPRPSCASCRFA